MKSRYLIAAIIAIVIGILIVLALLLNLPESNVEKPQQSGEYFWDKVEDINVTTTNDEDIKLSSFKGKITIINMWASWCSFCLEELPDFDKLQSDYKDKVTIIALNRAEAKSDVDNFIKSTNVNNLTVLTDKADKLYVKVGGFSMPETLFINKDGYLQVHKRGFMKYDEMKQIVDSLLR